eukprot:1966478-Ditylum_brightwellii.AAC.1
MKKKKSTKTFSHSDHGLSPQRPKKTSTGMLSLNIPGPGFLADPTHQIKAIGKSGFDILDQGKQHSSITKADCI